MNDRSESRDEWAHARDHFLELVDLSDDARESRLRALSALNPRMGARVASLLAHDRPAPPTPMPAGRFGAYQPVRRLGAGGMGEVWLGRRADGEFELDVAIKILRAGIGGEEGIRRFQRERQLLATLDHEYIARLIDGGTTEHGQPYLVLEYIEGLPLDVHCRQRQLSLESRLRLFVRVLAAVAHAHGRGVIHRDLKPGNVLVREDGAPRLLDFGISRPRQDTITDAAPLTRVGSRMFTLEYASPEQVRGEEVSEASDIYSLGVMLYELVADERPFRDSLSGVELERAVLETTPDLPSRRVGTSRRRALEGDLDTIVEKCLRKEPWARYRSASELIDDLERHLAGEPILARRTSAFARVARSVRRRPVLAIASLIVVLVAAIAAWSHRERRQERRSFLEATTARLDSAIGLREQGRVEESVNEIDSILGALAGSSDASALLGRAHVHRAIGSNHLRRFEDALRHLEAAESDLVATDARSKTLYASFLNARAYALAESGELEKGLETAHAAIAYCREHLPPGDPRTIDALLELADRRRKGVPSQEDLDNIDAVVAEARLRGNPRDATLGSALNVAAVVRADAYRYHDAIPLYEEAIAVLGWHHGEGQEPIAFLRTNLGDSYFRLGRFDEARAQHERALAARRALGNRANITISLEHLARIAIDTRDFDRAQSSLEEARAIVVELYSDDHPMVRRNRLWSGILDVERGEIESGCAAITREVSAHGSKTALPLAHEAQGRYRLGRAALESGDSQGRTDLERALRVFEREYGPEHRDTVAVKTLLERR